jgi:DNA-binding GntR family transcriptional regulator
MRPRDPGAPGDTRPGGLGQFSNSASTPTTAALRTRGSCGRNTADVLPYSRIPTVACVYTAPHTTSATGPSLTSVAYDALKRRLLAGDYRIGRRLAEVALAEQLGVSRTPVREALYKLEREGHIEVSSRNGWSVKPFDFETIENLYDVRIILELAATRRLCEMQDKPDLGALMDAWLVDPQLRLRDPHRMCELDEQFHAGLIAAAGNPEMARIHHEITGRIRIIRRLDFTQADRIDMTYDEHAQILRNIIQRKPDQARLLLRTHIESSKSVVRQITLHKLHTARPVAARQAS